MVRLIHTQPIGTRRQIGDSIDGALAEKAKKLVQTGSSLSYPGDAPHQQGERVLRVIYRLIPQHHLSNNASVLNEQTTRSSPTRSKKMADYENPFDRPLASETQDHPASTGCSVAAVNQTETRSMSR